MTKILDIAMADGRFYTFIDALQAAEMIDVLKQNTPFTLLAPTDDAFAVLQPSGVDALLEDKALLKRILMQHIIGGRMTAAQLLMDSPLFPLDGSLVAARVEADALYLGDAQVIMRDIEGDDGVMHALNKLISPA
jgi:uncharacterized surface protein with fasciclin (FAS1) repeats